MKGNIFVPENTRISEIIKTDIENYKDYIKESSVRQYLNPTGKYFNSEGLKTFEECFGYKILQSSDGRLMLEGELQ